MRHAIYILFVFVTFFSCELNSKRKKENNQNTGKVISVSESNITQSEPKLKVTYYNQLGKSFIEFIPVNINIRFSTIRPIEEDKIMLLVAGAFTSTSYKIEGRAIENGLIKNSVINKTLNGFVEIDSTKISFYKFGDSLIESISHHSVAKRNDLFQQQLLIFQSEVLECSLFGDAKNKRRALIEKDGHFSVIQSMDDLTIKDFQIDLKAIGVKNAIYLDMGSWSEGWYIDDKKVKQKLGDNFGNTVHQTSWIVYEK